MRPRLRRSDEEAPEQPAGEAVPTEEGLRQWQPRLYLKLILLFAVSAYAITFVLENRRQVHLHFVAGTAQVSLIWLILLSIGLGLLLGVLLSQLYRRRGRRH
jgi:uncharacterized integral membrane protein